MFKATDGGLYHPPHMNLPANFRPIVCTDEDLIALLEKIQVSPQKEVASLNEWNNPTDLIQQYHKNKELSKLLSFNKKMVLKLKADKGLACVLVNLNEKKYYYVQSAIKWALLYKTPVVAVPGLCAIMKHKVGLHVEILGIRKNPTLPFLKNIADKVIEFNIKNPNSYVPEKHRARRSKKPKAVQAKKDNANEKQIVAALEKDNTEGDKKIDDGKNTEENKAGEQKNVYLPKKRVEGFQYTKFRPRLIDGDAHVIKQLILQLPYLHVGQASSWDDLKGQTYPEIRSQLIIDRTPICFLLHRGLAGCVLISLDKFDKLNMKKLVHICVSLKVPVVIVPGLRTTFKTATALATNCIAIFKYTTDPLLDAILQTVKSFMQRYGFSKANRDKLQTRIDFIIPKQWGQILEESKTPRFNKPKQPTNKIRARKISKATTEPAKNEPPKEESDKTAKTTNVQEICNSGNNEDAKLGKCSSVESGEGTVVEYLKDGEEGTKENEDQMEAVEENSEDGTDNEDEMEAIDENSEDGKDNEDKMEAAQDEEENVKDNEQKVETVDESLKDEENAKDSEENIETVEEGKENLEDNDIKMEAVEENVIDGEENVNDNEDVAGEKMDIQEDDNQKSTTDDNQESGGNIDENKTNVNKEGTVKPAVS